MIARCTSSVCARSRISARRDSEKESEDQGATLSRSRCATTAAFTPPPQSSFERIVAADISSPMNRQRSAGATASARARATERYRISSTASEIHRIRAEWRPRLPSTIAPPASQATTVTSVASWNSFGASSSVVLRSSDSSRSYSPVSLAAPSRIGISISPAQVSWTSRGVSSSVTTKALSSASTSAIASPRRNSASRRIEAAGPRTSEMPGTSVRRLVPSPRNPRWAVVVLSGEPAQGAPVSEGFPVSTLTASPRLLARYSAPANSGSTDPNKCRDSVIALRRAS